MAEQHQLAADFVQDRAGYTTDPVTNLRSGAVFAAEIDGSPDAALILMEVGEDARNMILLHVNDDAAAYALLKDDLVQFTLFGVTVRGRVLKRRDSAASPQTDFWVMQLTNQDQT